MLDCTELYCIVMYITIQYITLHNSTVQYTLYCTVHALIIILYKGHVENLPEMTQGRDSHGCGSYYSGGSKVSLVVVVGIVYIILI